MRWGCYDIPKRIHTFGGFLVDGKEKSVEMKRRNEKIEGKMVENEKK